MNENQNSLNLRPTKKILKYYHVTYDFYDTVGIGEPDRLITEVCHRDTRITKDSERRTPVRVRSPDSNRTDPYGPRVRFLVGILTRSSIHTLFL